MVDNFHCYCGRGKRQTAVSCGKCLGIAGTAARKPTASPALAAPYAPSHTRVVDYSIDIYGQVAVTVLGTTSVPDTATPDFSGGGGTSDGGGASGSW